MTKGRGYEISRMWFNFAFENPDKVTSGHTALFLFLSEINNRMGWVENFQITASECMSGMSCKSYNTYKKCLDNLIEWKFVILVKKSTNQHQCSVIALSKFDKAPYKALDKAIARANDKAPYKAPETFINNETVETDKQGKTPVPPAASLFDQDCVSEDEMHEAFERFRKIYEGSKRGHGVELAALKKHKDWKSVVLLLYDIYCKELEWRAAATKANLFVPSPANLSTWINQRRWETEHPKIQTAPPTGVRKPEHDQWQ